MESLSFNGYLHSNPAIREQFDELLGYMGDYIENLMNAPKAEVDNDAPVDNAEVDTWIEENVDNLIDRTMELRSMMNKGFREMFELRIRKLESGAYQDPTAVKAAMDERIRLEKLLDALKVPTRVQFDRSFSTAQEALNTSEAKESAKFFRLVGRHAEVANAGKIKKA